MSLVASAVLLHTHTVSSGGPRVLAGDLFTAGTNVSTKTQTLIRTAAPVLAVAIGGWRIVKAGFTIAAMVMTALVMGLFMFLVFNIDLVKSTATTTVTGVDSGLGPLAPYLGLNRSAVPAMPSVLAANRPGPADYQLALGQRASTVRSDKPDRA